MGLNNKPCFYDDVREVVSSCYRKCTVICHTSAEIIKHQHASSQHARSGQTSVTGLVRVTRLQLRMTKQSPGHLDVNATTVGCIAISHTTFCIQWHAMSTTRQAGHSLTSLMEADGSFSIGIIMWVDSILMIRPLVDALKGTGLYKSNDDLININNGVPVAELLHRAISHYKTFHTPAAEMDQGAPSALQDHVTYLLTRGRRTFLLKSTAVD